MDASLKNDVGPAGRGELQIVWSGPGGAIDTTTPVAVSATLRPHSPGFPEPAAAIGLFPFEHGRDPFSK